MLLWPHFAVRGKTDQGNTKKASFFLHNVPAIDAELGNRYCTCRVRHRQVIGSMHGVPLSRYCQVYCPKLCQDMVRQIAVQCRLGWGGSAVSGGSAPAVARGSGRRQPSRSRSRSDPEVVPWTSSFVSSRGSGPGEANFLVE